MVDYIAQVKINGEVIPDWTSFQVRSQYGLAEDAFNIGLERPIELPSGSTVSISDGYGSTLVPLITEKEIEGAGGQSQFGGASSQLSGAGSSVSRKASLKHIYYVNQDWLDAIWGLNVVQNGVIYRANPGADPYQVEGVALYRLFLPGLPSRLYKDAQIECVVSSGWTHHSIALDLAQRAGYDLDVNVPDLDLQKTFAVPADQPYFSAISGLFSKWNPFIYIEGNTIIVRDYCGSRQTRPKGSNIISLSEQSFEAQSWFVRNEEGIIDHLLVQGPDKTFTFKRRRSLMRVKREPIQLPGTKMTLVSEESHDYDLGKLAQYSVNPQELIAEYSQSEKYRPKRSVRAITTVTDWLTDQSVTIKEDMKEYSGDGELIHRTLTEYHYADYNTPVESSTIEWGRRGVIGGGTNEQTSGSTLYYEPASFEFAMLSARRIIFGDFVGETGLVETDIYHYRDLLYIQDTIKKEGVEYDVNVHPLPWQWSQQVGIAPFDEDGDFANQLTLFSIEKVRFDAANPSLLRKNRVVQTLYPLPARQIFTEDIPIKRKTERKVVHRTWEYFNTESGLVYYEGGEMPGGEFRPLVTLNEPDVIEEHVAREIAYRQFSKKKSENRGGTIKLVAPVPYLKVGMSVRLPTCTKKALNWNNGQYEDVDIEGGIYWVTARTRNARYSGDVGSAQRTLDVYDELEVRQNY